ncbi:pantoate--beta-alanine ligase [Sphingobacterium faecale]|uniref:Pantothenate synthetase n=1 Tax=Sphingobacterium faecale TaxID=2803775 RepID=A0ABS1RAL9_9SPHI|nr:pantoate--beta-alanine ligase [Sphingobacterium faecale]MBL1410876.1 pantoate--beta-alanine ligase [Sphingobacterium faecale]
MEIYSTKSQLQAHLRTLREADNKIALVPTMGALHEGHLSLIREARKSADIIVCSIFVNPTQFNDPQDLEKYPRPIENDIQLLKSECCDILFLPSIEEMYPSSDETWHIDLGDLDGLWEGAKRPGHFQGVTQIVYKLFNLVHPDIACFGQKDFQQIMVIQRMIDVKQLPVVLKICPTVRSEKGLALSSRNSRLSEQGKENALVLFQALRHTRNNFAEKPIEQLHEEAVSIIIAHPHVTLEYFAICETQTLQQATAKENTKEYVVLVAAWIEGVRLIDNMLLNM